MANECTLAIVITTFEKKKEILKISSRWIRVKVEDTLNGIEFFKVKFVYTYLLQMFPCHS